MLDPRTQLQVIIADRNREIAATARSRLVPRPMASRRTPARLAPAVGHLLVRLGSWLARPGSAEPDEHGEMA